MPLDPAKRSRHAGTMAKRTSLPAAAPNEARDGVAEPIAEMMKVAELQGEDGVLGAFSHDIAQVARAANENILGTPGPKLVDLDGGVVGHLPRGLNRTFAALLSWLLLPFYITFGPIIRARTLRMAPAFGPTRGTVPGAGKPIRLLVLGDSAVAGVGVARTRQALPTRIAIEMGARTGRPVLYSAYGNNSAVAGDLRDFVVPNLPEQAFTHIVLIVGANDAKNFHSTSRWKREFGTLLYALRARYPDADIVWSRLFEFRKLPAIPAPLGWFLDLRRSIVCRVADELCLERGAHAAPWMDVTHAEGLSLDGFHPSELGCRAWAVHLATYMHSLERRERPGFIPSTEQERPAVPIPAIVPAE